MLYNRPSHLHASRNNSSNIIEIVEHHHNNPTAAATTTRTTTAADISLSAKPTTIIIILIVIILVPFCPIKGKCSSFPLVQIETRPRTVVVAQLVPLCVLRKANIFHTTPPTTTIQRPTPTDEPLCECF